MALRRQIRRTGRSLAITIPKDLVDLYEVGDGEHAEFEPRGDRIFRIEPVKRWRDEAEGLESSNLTSATRGVNLPEASGLRKARFRAPCPNIADTNIGVNEKV